MFFVFLILVFFVIVIASIIYGVIYVPSVPWAVEDMISFTKIKPGEKAVDLGSGDGRIVIALARKGVKACGYEINPFLVLWSRFKIWKEGLNSCATIYFGDFWKEDLSSYDVITIFVASYVMGKMEIKLKKELKKGGRVISESFKMPNWKEARKDGSFYMYNSDSAR